jgi:hypothetical protein
MRPRTKLKSVSLAAGYATSISLKPHLTRSLKNMVFCSMVIGLARDWFPSRRSVDNQIGGLVLMLLGQCRLGNRRGSYGRYFCEGSLLHGTSLSLGTVRAIHEDEQHRHVAQIFWSMPVVEEVYEYSCEFCMKDLVKVRKRKFGSWRWTIADIIGRVKEGRQLTDASLFVIMNSSRRSSILSRDTHFPP